RGSSNVGQRRQPALELGPVLLVVRRQREVLAERLERLVGGEAGAERRDLEQDPRWLAEVDGAEVEAIDDRGRSAVERLDALAPGLVLLDRRSPGDVMHGAGAGESARLR